MITMTTVGPTTAPVAAPAPTALPAESNGLPLPTLEALNPSDPMGEMMAILERINQTSTAHTERELRDAGTKLQEQLEKYMKLIADAIRRAQQAGKKKKKKGLLGKIASSVGGAVGSVVGKLVATVTMSPSLEKKIEGFTRGALAFSADLAAFNTKLAIALATNGPDAEKAWDEVKAEAKELFDSFKENCLENPEFMEVVGLLAKAGAVAAAVGSGGALAPLAAGVFLVCELDARTNIIADVVGEDAAPWVRVGMNIAASALVGAAGGDSAVTFLTAGAGVLKGASDMNEGFKLLDEGKRQAQELRHAATLQETLNRMHAYQRLIDELLVDMEDHAENQNRNRSLSNSVGQIQASTFEAVILRA
ncbi:MAG: hypothetical protein L6Q84_07735 [Polyangiaceae bacterium]|nr:hypothetical protein [Polyangiaceae bacterium]